MPVAIPPESQGISSWLGAAFSAFAENSAWSIGVDPFVFGIAWGEAVEGNHRDLTLDRPSC